MISVRRGADQLADLLEATGNLDAAMTVRGAKPIVYLWRLSQDAESGYDTYDSCVVAALDEASAKRIHPSFYGGTFDEAQETWVDSDGEPRSHGDWALSPDQVTAVCIGATTTEELGTVICASFNAG